MPFSSIEPVDQPLHGSNGFRGRKRAVSCTRNKCAAQEFLVARIFDDLLVGGLILHHHQAIALGMQRQDREMDFAVKDNIFLEVANGIGIGADARGIVERLQVGVQTETGLFVERMHFISVDRVRQLYSVVHASVPGDITPCARLKFGAKRKEKWEVNFLGPEELIRFLARKIGWGGLR